MTYDDIMADLNDAVYAAIRAAKNEDGAPVDALRNMAANIDSLIDTGLTCKEYADHAALYEGSKAAGWVS